MTNYPYNVNELVIVSTILSSPFHKDYKSYLPAGQHLSLYELSYSNKPAAKQWTRGNESEMSWFYIQWAGWAMKMMDNPLLSFSDDNNIPESFMSAFLATHVETFSSWTIAHIVPFLLSHPLCPAAFDTLQHPSKMKYQLFYSMTSCLSIKGLQPLRC